MPLMRRGGRPGLIGTAARTAVVVGTAEKVSDRHQRKVAERDAEQQPAQAAPAPAPVAAPAPAPTGGDDLTKQLERLGQLHASGTLTDAEFAQAKAQLLG